ncbi:MAG: ABC transporter permease [Chromatiales bacterium]
MLENRDAFLSLVQLHLKTSISRTALGYLYWLLDPLFLMAVYYFLVMIIFQAGEEDFHLFLLCGVIPWLFFSRALSQSTRAISANSELIRQIGIPIQTIVAVPIVVQFVFAAIGLLIVMAWSRQALGFQLLATVPLLVLIGVYSYGLALFLSVCEVHFRDTNEIMGYALRAGFLLTPILYPTSRVLESGSIPDAAKLLFQANPMAWIISSLRDLILTSSMYGWQPFAGLLVAGLLLVQLGLIWNRWQSRKIVKLL